MQLIAQDTVKGKLTSKNEAISFANVILRQSNDSSFVGGVVTDEYGSFLISVNETGSFFITASFIGFQTYSSNTLKLEGKNVTIDLGSIEMIEDYLALEEIQVVAERPLIVKEVDRTTINIENRVNLAGSSALEVLERSPGVVVNRQSSSLALMGKDGVNVMINGKIQYMPPDALFNFLEGQSATNIKSIELITTPPANLDAQGNAGFINIVLKTNPDEGLNGNYSLSAGYGRGEVGNASIGLNYSKDRWSFFTSYSYLRNGQEELSTLERINNANDLNLVTTHTFNRFPTQNNHNHRLGFDYQISPKTVVGVLVSGYSNRWDMHAQNNIELQSNTNTDSTIRSDIQEKNYWNHLQANINLSHEFRNRARIATDVDVLYFDNQNPINYDFHYLDSEGELIQSQELTTIKDTPFRIIVSKVDYQLPIEENLKISTGVKAVNSTFENDVTVIEDGVELSDFTSFNELTEEIYAGYVQAEYKFSKNLIKGGLRYEHTRTDLISNVEGQVVDRNFGALFPSLLLSRGLNDNQRLSMSYSRRINRPAFSDMAPFFIFLDPNTVFTGNPSLQPGISNTVQFDYTLGDVIFSTQYTWEDSTIVRFQNRFFPEEDRQIIIPDNLRGQQTYSASISLPIKLTDWRSMRYFGTYIWQKSVTVEGLGIYEFEQHNFRINGNVDLKLPEDFSLSVSGFYQTTSLVGNVQFDPLGILNFGLQRKLGENMRLTFNITDVFNSLERIGTTNLTDESVSVERKYDFSQRTFKLTLTGSFGNNKLRKARNRQTSEEKNRVN
jgi:outer membrane receptor protein involved in Fe transport